MYASASTVQRKLWCSIVQELLLDTYRAGDKEAGKDVPYGIERS
jgi:hypothetical protein